MLNSKTTHNPNGNIVWSDSPNSIFKLAYLSEQDIKYYCFGDGGGDGGAAADDVGGPPGDVGGPPGDVGGPPGDVDNETDIEFGEPITGMTASEAVGATSAANAVGGLAGIADPGPTPTNPKVLTAIEKRNMPLNLQEQILAQLEKEARDFNPAVDPNVETDLTDMTGFGTVGRTYGMEVAPEAFTPGFSFLGVNFGGGRGPLGGYSSTDAAVNAADEDAGFATSDVGSFSPWGFATGLLGLAGLPGKAAAVAINALANKGTFTADKAAVENMLGALTGKDAFSSKDAISEAFGLGKDTEAVTFDTSRTYSDAPYTGAVDIGRSSVTSDENSFGEIGEDSAPQGLAAIIAQPPAIVPDQINPSTVNQPVSNISRSVRPPNQPLTVEETLGRATLGGGFNTRQAGGLVSLGNNKRTNPVFAQSGGNIGGLMNIGPNVIDVINRGIAMPENIGAVQMQEKIDINQSTPYTSR